MKLIAVDQLDDAARTLAEAFWDDPLMQIVAPNESKRAKVGPWFFSKAVAYGLRWGEVWGNDEASAVAVWLPPGNTDAQVACFAWAWAHYLSGLESEVQRVSCARSRPRRSSTRP